MPSALDVFNATNHAHDQSVQTLGGLLQNAFTNVGSSITEAGKLNQGVMQTAINAQQIALDTWWKQKELEHQNKSLELQAQGLQLRDKEFQLNYDYHNEALRQQNDFKDQQLNIERQKEKDANVRAFIGDASTALQRQQMGYAADIHTDESYAEKVMGLKDPASPISIFTSDMNGGDPAIAQYKEQFPIIQQRIAEKRAKLEKINNNLGLLADASLKLANGLPADNVIKSLSQFMSPQDLNPKTYEPTYGEPIPDRSVDSVDTNIYGDTQTDGVNTTAPIPNESVKLSYPEMQAKINYFISQSTKNKLQEEDGYPTMQAWMNQFADDNAKQVFRQKQLDPVKQLATGWFDKGSNPSSTEQKLEKDDPNLVKEFRRNGGDPRELDKYKQLFTDWGQQARDGSILKNPTASVPAAFAPKLTPDATGTIKGLNALEVSQLRDNLINSTFNVNTSQGLRKDKGGRVLDGSGGLTYDSGVELVKKDASGNKIINVPYDTSLVPEEDQGIGNRAISSMNKNQTFAKQTYDSVMTNGKPDDNKIVQSLSSVPAEYILGNNVASPYYENGTDQDYRTLAKLKTDKIKELVQGNKYGEIQNIIHSYFKGKDQQQSEKDAGIMGLITRKGTDLLESMFPFSQ